MAKELPYDGPMPFRNPNEKSWMLKIRDTQGKWHNRSTGVTADHPTDPMLPPAGAMAIAREIQRLRAENTEEHWKLIDGIALRGMPRLRDVISHRSRIDTHTTDEKTGRREKRSDDAIVAEINRTVGTVNLDQWLDKWADDPFQEMYHGRAAKPEQKAKYIRQLRIIIPKGAPMPVDWFTTKNLMKMFERLNVGTSTRRKYRTACSQFAKFLRREQVLFVNPAVEGVMPLPYTRDEVKERDENKFYAMEQIVTLLSFRPDPMHLSREQARNLEPWRAFTALAFGAGTELGAAANMKRKHFLDLDLGIYSIPGTKNTTRSDKNRTGENLFLFTREAVADYVKTLGKEDWFLPRASDGKSERHQDGALRAIQQMACDALGIPNYGFHKHRRSLSVWNAKNKLVDKRVIQDNLGHHKNSTVIDKDYIVYDVQDKVWERARARVQEQEQKQKQKQKRAPKASHLRRA